MKKYFVVIYWASFESDKNSKHDRLERFWFWKAPSFFEWIKNTRSEIEKSKSNNLVMINCGKY